MLRRVQTQGFGSVYIFGDSHLSVFCYRPAANATEICLALAVAALPRSPLPGSVLWLIQRAVYLAVAVSYPRTTLQYARQDLQMYMTVQQMCRLPKKFLLQYNLTKP